MTLIFATRNPGKLKEMHALLSELDITVFSAEKAGVDGEAIEDGKTFEENALKKALYVQQQTKQWTIADDSGLCINALNGKPGVLSARWAGENVSDDDLLIFTLKQLQGTKPEDRTAKFVTVAALVSPEGQHWLFTGEILGTIAHEPRGKRRPRLPYDQIFSPDCTPGRTFAELSDKEKNDISHRSISFGKLKDFLSSL